MTVHTIRETTSISTRQARPCFRSAPRRALPSIAVALALAGCGGGGDATSEPVELMPIGGETPDRPAPEDDPVPEETDPPEASFERETRDGLDVRFPEGADVETLASPWLAVIDVFQNAPLPTETGEVFVQLVRYTPDLAFRSHVDFYTRTLDTCEIDSPDDTGGEDEEENVDDGKRSVNGGDEITLSSAGGLWLSVPYSRERTAYVHDDDAGGFPSSLPADLTLSLTGAEFPAVDALPIGQPAPPVRLSPAIDEPVSPDTEYRWTPIDDGSITRIVFKNFVDGEFQGFPVSCRVRDDGVFELPDDARAALAALPGETTVRYAREINRIEFRNGVALFQSVDIVDD